MTIKEKFWRKESWKFLPRNLLSRRIFLWIERRNWLRSSSLPTPLDPSLSRAPTRVTAIHQGTKNLGNEFFFLEHDILSNLTWHGSMRRVSSPMRPTQRRPDPVLFPPLYWYTDPNVIRFHAAGWTNVNYCWHFRRPRRFRPGYFHASYFHALGDHPLEHALDQNRSFPRSINEKSLVRCRTDFDELAYSRYYSERNVSLVLLDTPLSN